MLPDAAARARRMDARMKRLAALALLFAACAKDVAIVDVYRSRDAYLKRESEAYLGKHGVEDFADLEEAWNATAANYPQPAVKAGPLLQTALVEIARNRAEKLYRASLPYGKASRPRDGAYYLALAEASRQFADSIEIRGRLEAPPDREQIRAALQAMEREAYEKFDRDPSRKSLVFSARLKEARELLERGSLAGATLVLLETRRDASPRPRVKGTTQGKTTLHALFRDHPAALSLLDAMTARALTATQVARAPITVTLIRWPSTCSLSDPASLLAQEIVRQFGTQARFVVEDYGASPLAERFGVDRYPAVFVDDALVARPEDFYEWGGAGAGRYLPWQDPAQRREFQQDLARMIDVRLAGGRLRSAKITPAKEQTLPALAAARCASPDHPRAG